MEVVIQSNKRSLVAALILYTERGKNVGILMIDLKVGEYFKTEIPGIVWRVECNDWWDDGKLRDFIVVDANGNKKHFGHVDKSTTIHAERVYGFDEMSEIDRLKAENQRLSEALGKIAYTPSFNSQSEIEVFADRVIMSTHKALEGEPQ